MDSFLKHTVALSLVLCTTAVPTALPAQPEATIPQGRYALERLVPAGETLLSQVRGIHESLGTPLVSSGIYYVVPLLDAIDREAARRRSREVVGELANLPTMGPDGGHLYSWMYRIPPARALATGDIHVCYAAVGLVRAAGSITPTGEFRPVDLASLAELNSLTAPLTCAQVLGRLRD